MCTKEFSLYLDASGPFELWADDPSGDRHFYPLREDNGSNDIIPFPTSAVSFTLVLHGTITAAIKLTLGKLYYLL